MKVTAFPLRPSRAVGPRHDVRTQLLCGAAVIAASMAVDTPAAMAQTAPGTNTVEEVVVTANRRAQDVTSIPFNISVVGSEQLSRTGVITLQDLSKQIPNLNIGTNGARYLVAQTPIIRGLNASGTVRASALAQPPVATYLGNTLVGGYFPIEDVARVEVLRGPQGTLYGAGSLGGTIRLIPAEPSFAGFSGHVGGSAGRIGHSTDVDHSVEAVVNVPVGETFAFRLSGKSKYDAGFIDQIAIIATEGYLGRPILANPADIVNSRGVYFAKKDVNWARTDTFRASTRWKPTDALEVNLAFNYASMKGEGGPLDNPYGGGPSPGDSRIIIPPVANYESSIRTREPWFRDSRLASADVSYDAGFATLSTTTSYLDTHGRSTQDATFGYLQLPAVFLAYYIGNPANPRFYASHVRDDGDETFTQEVRVVSSSSDRIEYTVGAYYQNTKQYDNWDVYAPGHTEQTRAGGGGVVTTDEFERFVTLGGNSTFREEALFGELTWHLSPRWQVTGGGRIFKQSFSRTAFNTSFAFFIDEEASSSSKFSDQIFKLNTSFELTDRHRLYAIFSQGFRRGGANAFSLTGFLAEPRSLLSYSPDKVDNYEVGLKGRFESGWAYTADLFNVDWSNTQIDLITPGTGWPVVTNGGQAKSRGVELEVSGPITSELRLVAGYAYADAELSNDFCVATGDGGGGVSSCGIRGIKGGRLPGAPRHTAAATLSYDHTLANADAIDLTLNLNYKGSVLSELPTPFTLSRVLDSYWLVNASAGYARGSWRVSVYAQNLLDKRAAVGFFGRRRGLVGDAYQWNTINTPRQFGVSLRYNF